LDDSIARPARKLIPFAGLRLVFALINGAIWFALGFGICSGISLGVAAAGRLTPGAVVVFAGTVAFFVPFFGLSGAISGFLDQAASGRFQLPVAGEQASRATPARGGLLASIWVHGTWLGLIVALVAAGLAQLHLQRSGVPSRGDLCLALGGMAGVIAMVQSAWMVRPRHLGDLEIPSAPPPPPSTGYYLTRFGVPQGVGNGVITALAAIGTFPPNAADLKAIDVTLDAMSTALVIAFFMVLSAGDLAGTDRKFGRVGAAEGAPPGRLARAGIVALTAVAAGILGYALARLGGPEGLSMPVMVAWKGALGAVVGGLLAARAARWKLSYAG
jgi:hypothetical protein